MQTAPARRDVVALLRFVAAGGAGNAVYSLVYLALAQSGGVVVPSLVASAVSTLAVNETHRRWTFRGTGRPSLRDAHLSGAASAVVGTALTAAVLALADVLAPGTSTTTQLVLSWAVTALVGAANFVHLRWTATAGRAARGVDDVAAPEQPCAAAPSGGGRREDGAEALQQRVSVGSAHDGHRTVVLGHRG